MMRKKLFIVFFTFTLLAALVVPCFAGGEKEKKAETGEVETGEKIYQIAYLSPSFDISDAWERPLVAMKYRLDELGVKYELTVLATSGATAHEEQLGQVETMIQRGVDYLFLGPGSFDACVPALKVLGEAGVPTVVYNYTFEHEDPEAREAVLQYVGFDHGTGGRAVGNWIVDYLGGKGKLAIIYGPPGPLSDMRGGEAKKITEAAGIETVYEHYADFDRIKAYEATSNLLMAQPDVDVIYAIATAMALGAASAVAEVGKSDDIAVVGFGATKEEFDAICKGTMKASPLRMIDDSGIAVADAFYAHMQGQTDELPKIWDGPFVMIDSCDEEGKFLVEEATRISKPIMGY